MNQRNDPEELESADLVAIDGLKVVDELVECDSDRVQEIFEFGDEKDSR